MASVDPFSSWEEIKKRKVSIGTVAFVLALLAFGATRHDAWVDINFISETEAGELQSTVAKNTEAIKRNTKAIDETKELLAEHVTEFRMMSAHDRVSNLENRLFQLEQRLQAQTGDDRGLRADLHETSVLLELAKSYRACLVQRLPNCQHLRNQLNQ